MSKLIDFLLLITINFLFLSWTKALGHFQSLDTPMLVILAVLGVLLWHLIKKSLYAIYVKWFE